MKIYIVRHGVAEERGGGVPDEDRALTKAGKRKTRKAMRGFAALHEAPVRILSSPLVRAWQTAKILARALEADGPRVEAGLAPGGDKEKVLARLARERKESVALVGHEPDLSELGALIAGARFELKKAAIARIDGDPHPGGGRLAWLLPPLLLERLAR